jgi:hypothetical protein
MNEQHGLSARKNQDASAPAEAPGTHSRWVLWLGALLVIALLVLTTSVWARPLLEAANTPGPNATTVNYQGRLADAAGAPLSGSYAMTFALWDAPSGGNLVWGPESHADVPVSEGLFNAGLGSLTSGGIPTSAWGGDRYLEIAVGGETLSPRELIRSVPVAGMALSVPDDAIGSAQIADGGVASGDLALDGGTACLAELALVSLSAGETVDVPGLSLGLTLDAPARVLVWIDGLARFEQASDGESSVVLAVDGTPLTGERSDDGEWFNLNGQRMVDLAAGAHTLTLRASSAGNAGTMSLDGSGPYQTCVNYLVLGAQ